MRLSIWARPEPPFPSTNPRFAACRAPSPKSSNLLERERNNRIGDDACTSAMRACGNRIQLLPQQPTSSTGSDHSKSRPTHNEVNPAPPM